MKMVEGNEDSRDRIDPVTGIRTGEVSDAESGQLEPGENPAALVLNRIASTLNTSQNILILIGLGFSLLFLPTIGSELAPNSSLFSEIIPTMIQSWVTLAVLIVLVISLRRLEDCCTRR